MMKILEYNRYIIASSLVGIMVSTYALYVEMAAEAKPDYEALCDISEYAKCSRVLTSEYSKGFGFVPKGSSLEVPNCIYGIAFYCIVAFLATYNNKAVVKIQLLLSLTSVATSVYLGYLLLYVLKDFCVVCVSTYFVNIAITVLIYKKFKSLSNKDK